MSCRWNALAIVEQWSPGWLDWMTAPNRGLRIKRRDPAWFGARLPAKVRTTAFQNSNIPASRAAGPASTGNESWMSVAPVNLARGGRCHQRLAPGPAHRTFLQPARYSRATRGCRLKEPDCRIVNEDDHTCFRAPKTVSGRPARGERGGRGKTTAAWRTVHRARELFRSTLQMLFLVNYPPQIRRAR